MKFLLASLILFSSDVCDLSRLYNDQYQYSLPQPVLESFLSGKAFDHPEFYTLEESENLLADIREIYRHILAKNPVKEKRAVITAGAPGAGKTVKLRQDLEAHRGRFAYVCPDDVCLQNMRRTYGTEASYTKWRPGSNGAAHLIVGNLIREGYGLYFGSTSTSPNTCNFFAFLKAQGYKIRLIHVTAPDAVRWASIQERDKTFVQTMEQDVREKGLLLPQRIRDTYLKFADEIEFYYREAVNQDAVLVACWRSETDALQVHDKEKYENLKAVHNQAVKVLSRPELLWKFNFLR